MKAPSTPDVSWVLPLYRTAPFLDELLRRIDGVSAQLGLRHEVLLVDDACPGGSGAAADRAAASDARVRVLHLPRNRGQDNALREGLRAARGAWAVVLDADLQDPPEALLALWPLRDRANVVFVARFGRYTTASRRMTSWMYRAAVALVGGLPRGACLHALLDRRAIDAVAATRRESLSMLAAIAAIRCTTACVPLERPARPQGTSAYGHRMRLAKATASLWQMLLARRLGRQL